LQRLHHYSAIPLKTARSCHRELLGQLRRTVKIVRVEQQEGKRSDVG
jgi:hypothetical protein